MTKTTKKARRRGETPANLTRDAILDYLKAHSRLRRHPAETMERLYISGFQAANGVTLALDKAAASKQPIWVRLADFPGHALPHIDRKFYSPADGRNSNLRIFGGDFKNGLLVRLYPNTCADAAEIVDQLLMA